jgi:hypothetical protein
VEINYEPEQWSARRLLGRMVHCTDVMPRETCDDIDLPAGTTYGRAAQHVLAQRRSATAWGRSTPMLSTTAVARTSVAAIATR